MVTYLILIMLTLGEPPTTVRFLVVDGPAACGKVAAIYLADPPKFPGKTVLMWSVSCVVQAPEPKGPPI